MALDLGRWLDRAIEPFSPRLARRREVERIALKEVRAYDAGSLGRRTAGWKRPSTSADREAVGAIVRLRNGARELVRNNKYAAAAVRQIVSNMVGDGITATLSHPTDKAVAAAAQADWDEWANGLVDGRHDFYGHQKLMARAAIEGGEALQMWLPDANGPDGMVRGLEPDYLDHNKFNWLQRGAGRIIQGVEFDAAGIRDGYWLFPEHPGDWGGWIGSSDRFPARDIDHVFEPLRLGQTRGVSWFAPVALDMRDLGDYEDAIRMKRKVEACLALILTPADGAPSSPIAAQTSQEDASKPSIETLRPGMIFRTKAGETATALEPSSGADGVDFLRMQLMGISANLAPYHLMTGDVSQANYSSLRACLLGFWANLDDWQQNMMLPFCCQPAMRRRLKRLALLKGDKRFLQVKASWAMPARRFVDPLKDYLGELGLVRMGGKSLRTFLAERGINLESHFADLAQINGLIDQFGLAIEADPRRLTDQGILQLAAGYIAPKGAASDN